MKSKNIVSDMSFANNFKKPYKFRNNGKSNNFKAGLTFLQGREKRTHAVKLQTFFMVSNNFPLFCWLHFFARVWLVLRKHTR